MIPRPIILIVDDDSSIRALLAHVLRAGGYEICEAETGAAALVLARACPPSLVLLDYQLPDMDGPAVTRALKAMLPDLPILLLTASQDAAHVEEAFGAGADDYVTKPFNARIIVTRVRATLQAREDREASQRSDHVVRERDTLMHDLAEARRVQGAQLPALPLRAGLWHIEGAMTPCTAVGGDLYDIVETSECTTVFLLDVSGHGTGAALVATSVAGALRGLLQSRSIGEAMIALNAQLGSSRSGRYACVAAVALHADHIGVINAGLPPVVILRHDRPIAEISAGGVPPGLLPSEDYDLIEVAVEEGDRIVLLSDGLTEPFGPCDAFNLALDGLGLMGLARVGTIRERLDRLVGIEPQDDATVLVATRGPHDHGERP